MSSPKKYNNQYCLIFISCIIQVMIDTILILYETIFQEFSGQCNDAITIKSLS